MQSRGGCLPPPSLCNCLQSGLTNHTQIFNQEPDSSGAITTPSKRERCSLSSVRVIAMAPRGGSTATLRTQRGRESTWREEPTLQYSFPSPLAYSPSSLLPQSSRRAQDEGTGGMQKLAVQSPRMQRMAGSGEATETWSALTKNIVGHSSRDFYW